ncbi:MAG TPA: DUF1360 domain-containing protein [Thermoleophilaceae bacterium]|nr:DUF1360 domain-containing protein [Thermoleophilaceae bacterium]
MTRETGGTPTEPFDYWLLNAGFAVAMGSLGAHARAHPERVEEALRPGDMPLVAAATFALAKVVARERIAVWLREPFVERAGEGRRPRGTRLRYAVGELLTCTRCMGAWSALSIVGLRIVSPPAGRVVTGVLAASAANDFLQLGFRLATDRADATPSG